MVNMDNDRSLQSGGVADQVVSYKTKSSKGQRTRSQGRATSVENLRRCFFKYGNRW